MQHNFSYNFLPQFIYSLFLLSIALYHFHRYFSQIRRSQFVNKILERRVEGDVRETVEVSQVDPFRQGRRLLRVIVGVAGVQAAAIGVSADGAMALGFR
jgi:hypothetical protein